MRNQLLGAAVALAGVAGLADTARAQVSVSFGSSPYFGNNFSIGFGNPGFGSPAFGPGFGSPGFYSPGVVPVGGFAAPVYGVPRYGSYYGGYRGFYGSPYRGGTFYTTPGWGGGYGGRRYYRYR